MTEFTQSVAAWWLHAAAAGAAVFGLGWAWLRRTDAPDRRHTLGGWVVRGSLVAAVLCLFPAWLLLPAPAAWDEVVGAPEPTAAAPEQPPVEDGTTPVAHEWESPLSEADEWVLLVRPVPGDDGTARAAPEPLPWAGVVRMMGDPAAEPRGAARIATPLRPVEDAPRPPAERPESAPAAGGEASPWPGVLRLVLGAYAVGAAAAGLPLLLGAVALARLRRSGRPAPARVQAVFDELAAGLRPAPRLLISDKLGSPVCFGLVWPVVLLPKSLAGAATEAELRWVFAHELDHIRRGDPWSNWWVGLARAVYFFVPWFWRVKGELALAQEHLADAAAAAAGGRVEDYAAFLVKLSGDPAGRRCPAGAAAVRAGQSELYRRVTMLLASKDRAAPRASRRWSLGVAVAVLGSSVLVSGVGFARPAADDNQPRPEARPREQPRPERRDDEREKEVRKAQAQAERAKAQAQEEKEKAKAKPGDAQVGPPPELRALREAVEAAARKGENVDDIRRQLDQLERALTGKAWTKPKPADPLAPAWPAVPARPGVPGVPPVPPVPPLALEFPRDFPFGGANPDDLKKAQEALRRAAEQLARDPENLDAQKALRAAEEALRQALPNLRIEGRGGAFVVPDVQWGGRVVGRGGEGRLGVRLGQVPPVVADQLDLPKGRGLVVVEVVQGMPAEKAGLRANDIILEFAGKEVADNTADFLRLVEGVKAGDKVDILIVRKGRKDVIKGVELPEAKRVRGVEVVPAPKIERPKVELTPRVRPVPVPPEPPAAGEARRSSVQVQVSDGEFTIKADQDGVKYVIEGTAEGGKARASRIEITDGEKKIDARSVERVPAEYRKQVERLIEGVRFSR